MGDNFVRRARFTDSISGNAKAMQRIDSESVGGAGVSNDSQARTMSAINVNVRKNTGSFRDSAGFLR